MKNILIAAIFCCVYQVNSQAICLNNCRDIGNSAFCKIMTFSRGCGYGMNRILCPLSCNVCQKCDPNNAPAGVLLDDNARTAERDCELETCVDMAPADQCSTIKNVIRNGCAIYSRSCRLTCNQCTPCPKPKPAQEKCIINCEDFDESCSAWKSRDFCKDSSKYYTYTSQKCPMSCGICNPCPTPKPLNTALPPTPPSCIENCVDIEKQFCGYWKEKGFCNQTEKSYPYLLEVCALTCEACLPCPTEKPTPPPCRRDCRDANNNCKQWQERGHCNDVSVMCPESCGVCTACRSTALPPTREKIEGSNRLPPTREEIEGSNRLPPTREKIEGSNRLPPTREEIEGSNRLPPTREEIEGSNRLPPTREKIEGSNRLPPTREEIEGSNRLPPTREEIEAEKATNGSNRLPPTREEIEGSNRLPPTREGIEGSNRLPPTREEIEGSNRLPPSREEIEGSNRLPPTREEIEGSNRLPPTRQEVEDAERKESFYE